MARRQYPVPATTTPSATPGAALTASPPSPPRIGSLIKLCAAVSAAIVMLLAAVSATTSIGAAPAVSVGGVTTTALRHHPLTLRPEPVATTAANESIMQFVLLPVGDSLTQGVGKYGSYRAPLLRQLRRALSASRVTVDTTGPRRWPCTVKLPGVPFTAAPASADDAGAHAGYCNWASDAILGAMIKFIEDQHPKYHAALLLMGHNDVFRVARAFRVPEGCVPSSAASSPAVAKAANALRDGLRANLEHAAKLLVANAAEQTPHGASIMSDVPRLVIGLNPPTGFPCLDTVVHSIVHEVASSVSLSSVARGVGAVAVAAFDGFQRGVHTFDTTHPNEDGAVLMAQRWQRALRIDQLPP